MIAFVWAEDQAGTIGHKGRLPWHLPDDLAFFKRVTLGQLMVMGRKTYEGLPKRPLPGRTNVVVTRDPALVLPGATVVTSKQAVLALAQANLNQDVMVVGGAQVFAMFMDVVDTLYVTRLAGTFEGDVTMPSVPWAQFELTASKTVFMPEKAYTHTFETWRRKPAAY